MVYSTTRLRSQLWVRFGRRRVLDPHPLHLRLPTRRQPCERSRRQGWIYFLSPTPGPSHLEESNARLFKRAGDGGQIGWIQRGSTACLDDAQFLAHAANPNRGETFILRG